MKLLFVALTFLRALTFEGIRIAMAAIPSGASSAVLKPSDPVPEDAVTVQGPNFDEPLSLDAFLSSYERIGFQANHLGRAINVVNKMVRHRPFFPS